MAILQLLQTLLLCHLTVGQSVTFLAIGDWGADPTIRGVPGEPSLYGYDDQKRVANGMNTWCAANGCDFIMSTGDNFYPDGVTSPTDPRFDTSWRDVYNQTALKDLTWYITLGNHDHYVLDRNSSIYQVQFGDTEPRWYLPDQYYQWVYDQAGLKIQFIGLDTDSINFNWFNRTEQLIWFNETLATSAEIQPDWLMVYAHHPIKSCGRYAPGNFLLDDLLSPAMDQWNVDLYIDGHDHNLQHIIRNDSLGIDYVVTGGGGKGRYELSPARCNRMQEGGYALQFFAESYGFSAITVTPEQVTGRLIDDLGQELYSFTKARRVVHRSRQR